MFFEIAQDILLDEVAKGKLDLGLKLRKKIESILPEKAKDLCDQDLVNLMNVMGVKLPKEKFSF